MEESLERSPMRHTMARVGSVGQDPFYTRFGLAGILATLALTLGGCPVEQNNDDSSVLDEDNNSTINTATALALINFRVSAVYAAADAVDSAVRDAVQRLPHLAWLRDRFRGRAIHTEGWSKQLDGLLG